LYVRDYDKGKICKLYRNERKGYLKGRNVLTLPGHSYGWDKTDCSAENDVFREIHSLRHWYILQDEN
jgi:hypothetical protein